jgi:hypothetical protein
MDETRRLDELLDLENRSEVAVYHKGNLVFFDTRETRFFDAWKEMPGAVIPARYVRILTKAIYGQTLHYRDWLKPQSFGLSAGVWLPPLYDAYRIKPAKDYHFDGLAALNELFANETYHCIRFQSVTTFPELAKCAEKYFGVADEACTFEEWQKGYLLALLRFGDTKAGNSSSSEILAKYSGDIELVVRYTEAAKTGRRDLVGVLKAFAWMWDAFFLPLRYFKGQAAMDFSGEWLGYSGKDLSTFGRVFYRGGGDPTKNGNGLKLKLVIPSIVRQWSDETIAISRQATVQHGFDMHSLSEALNKCFKRRVISR